MWGLVIGSITVFLTVIFSLAKVNSKREESAKDHLEELLARKQAETFNDQKNITSNNGKEHKEIDVADEQATSKEK